MANTQTSNPKELTRTIESQLFDLDQSFKKGSNLVSYIDEAQRFYNGDQYPNSNNKNMIRITLNICSFSVNIKASKICGTPIYLKFVSDNPNIDCTALRQFDEYNCNKLHLDTNNYQTCLNALVNGSEVTLIRWDPDDTTYKGIYKGGLKEEHIDLRNFAVADPYIDDIQNQEWAMFWDDYPYGSVKELIEGKDEKEKKEKIRLLKKDCGIPEDYKDETSMNTKLVRMFTRFYRIDGEVYFNCATDNVNLFAYPHPLSKKVAKEFIKKVVEEYKRSVASQKPDEDGRPVKDLKIDYEDIVSFAVEKKMFSTKDYKKIKEKFYLYPFAVFKPYSINRSFYGRSDVKNLIPIQRGLNFIVSMVLKCAENNAYNKIIVKPKALGNQTITNEPSQVLVDNSEFTNTWGIKFAETQPLPNGLLDFADKIFSLARVIYSFNDVMDGSITNQDMSGYMLQQMIKQSNTTIEQQQKLFWVYNEEKAAIRVMYYKHYVDQAKYAYSISDAEYEGEEQARNIIYNILSSGQKLPLYPDAKKEDFANKTHKDKIGTIKGEDLYGSDFDISFEAVQGLNDSKLVDQQIWDNLFLNGGLQNVDPEVLEMYLSVAPNISPDTKTSLKKVVENLKYSKYKQLQAQYQQLLQENQNLKNYSSQLEAANGYYSQYNKNLTAEFSDKINNANKIIMALNKDLQKQGQTGVMSPGEVKSHNSTGTSGSIQVGA